MSLRDANAKEKDPLADLEDPSARKEEYYHDTLSWASRIAFHSRSWSLRHSSADALWSNLRIVSLSLDAALQALQTIGTWMWLS